MKQIKGVTTHTYRWWRADGKDILPEDEADLRDHALERIAEMIGDDYREGELAFDSDNEQISYTGWWSIKMTSHTYNHSPALNKVEL
jgi:hypothetical protein